MLYPHSPSYTRANKHPPGLHAKGPVKWANGAKWVGSNARVSGLGVLVWTFLPQLSSYLRPGPSFFGDMLAPLAIYVLFIVTHNRGCRLVSYSSIPLPLPRSSSSSIDSFTSLVGPPLLLLVALLWPLSRSPPLFVVATRCHRYIVRPDGC